MSRRRTNRSRGRPTTSNDFQLVVVPRREPDLRMFGGALVALSLHRARVEKSNDSPSKETHDGSA